MGIKTLLGFLPFILSAAAGEIQRCGPPAIPHNVWVRIIGTSVSDGLQSQSYAIGTTAEVICDEGYEVIGNPFITCSGQGFWQGEQPLCGINVARGKKAYQSSTVPGGNAANALDGSSSQTEVNDTPWLTEDLKEQDVVCPVALTSPPCCYVQLRDLEMYVANSTTHGQKALCRPFPGPVDYGGTQVIRCSRLLTGRYVSIEMAGVRGSLSLCHVQVMSPEVRPGSVENPGKDQQSSSAEPSTRCSLSTTFLVAFLIFLGLSHYLVIIRF